MSNIEETSVVDYSSLNTVSEAETTVVDMMTKDRANGTTQWVEDSLGRKILRNTGKVTVGGLLMFGAYAVYNHFSE